MDNTAENMDFIEAEDNQLSKLQSGETDTETVIGINELRDDIGRQLAHAEEEGVISKRDVKKWSNILKESGNSKQEVANIQHQVLAVIEESKRLIAELPAGDKEVAIFRHMSIREKREYLTNLRKAADDLNGRADNLGELFPDAVEKLQTLRGVERARYIEELNIRRVNVAKYGTLMEKHAKHFSKKSQKEFMDMFKELSIAKQTDWLSQFEETQAKPRAKLSSRYESLPPKIRERIEDFFEMARHDKEKVVTKAEEENAFADRMYGNPDHKYMSSESRKFMKKTFIGADTNLRKAMMEMLDKTIKDESSIGKKFEKLPPEARNKCSDFNEKSFEDKEKTLDALMVDDYERRLKPWVEKKIIGESTQITFMDWFRELDYNGKMAEGSDAKIKGQMVERIVLKDRFEKELPADVQKANAHFYSMGQHARMDLFEKLKRAAEPKASAAETGTGEEAAPANDNVVEKRKSPVEKQEGQKAVNDNAVEQTREVDEATVLEEVKKAKQESSLIKKRVRDENIAEELVDLTTKSDLANQGVYDSTRKDNHLLSQKERDLNEQLVKFSGGKVVAESGHGKAKKVKEVDLNKLEEGVITEDEMLDLKKEAVNNQGEKRRDVFHLQFADRKSGQKLSGAMGRQKVAEQKKGLQNDIADRVAQRMGLKEENADKNKREKVRSIVRKDRLKVDLREAA
jgi:hypothetical protein